MDEAKIIEIVSKYENLSDFRKNEMSLYSKLIRSKTLDKYTSQLKRTLKSWSDRNDILNEIDKYEYLLDFIKTSHGCYLHIKRNKLDHLLDKLKRKRSKSTKSINI